MASKDPRTNVVNLFILAIAILLVCVTKNKFSEMFVAKVPIPPYNNGYGAQGGVVVNGYPGFAQGGNPPTQYTTNHVRNPYYAGYNKPYDGDCGVLGRCENGVCGEQR